MSKTIKTPAMSNVDFAADNTDKALRTFTSVVNGVQYVVEAETVEEAHAKLEAAIEEVDQPKPENT